MTDGVKAINVLSVPFALIRHTPAVEGDGFQENLVTASKVCAQTLHKSPIISSVQFRSGGFRRRTQQRRVMLHHSLDDRLAV
jgi:hypothetical protein